MTTTVTIPNNGAYHLVASGSCRIQFTGDVYAVYGSSQPANTVIGHAESVNIAYPGDENVYLKVRGSSRNPAIQCVVTTVEV